MVYMRALDAKIAESSTEYFEDSEAPQEKLDIAVYKEIIRRGIGNKLDDELLPNLKRWFENMKQRDTKANEEESESEEETKEMTAAEIESKLTEIKAAGNGHFKSQSFDAAIVSFTEAIELYLEHEETVKKTPNLVTLVTQCFTNRSLGWHKMNNQVKAYEDADYVLRELDSDNMKALYRRAHAMGKEGRLQEAIADLKKIVAKAPSDVMVLELEALQRKLAESEAKESTQAETPQTLMEALQEDMRKEQADKE